MNITIHTSNSDPVRKTGGCMIWILAGLGTIGTLIGIIA